ncbi:MAG: RNA polymerase sigma factor [Chloroflexi bacterium]|nr:RNA polymerase sigma factor [Chloroflexota bacterium]
MLENEKMLVEKAKTDSNAFAKLYDFYVERIYAYAFRQLQEESAAQDITAVTFEKALRHIRSYQWQGKSVCAWLYRIARNEMIQQHRKQRWQLPWQPFYANGRSGNGEFRQPETSIMRSQQEQLLHDALNTLSIKDSEILKLRFFEGLTGDEIAEVFDCSTNSAYVRLHRALNRLRQQMDTVLDSQEIAHVSK